MPAANSLSVMIFLIGFDFFSPSFFPARPSDDFTFLGFLAADDLLSSTPIVGAVESMAGAAAEGTATGLGCATVAGSKSEEEVEGLVASM